MSTEPTREEVNAWSGPAVLEFGAEWCPHCQAAAPLFAAAIKNHPHIKHQQIPDGPGRPLGRSYRVKLWPTFIFLKDGQEMTRIVRPESEREIRDALDEIEAED